MLLPLPLQAGSRLLCEELLSADGVDEDDNGDGEGTAAAAIALVFAGGSF